MGRTSEFMVGEMLRELVRVARFAEKTESELRRALDAARLAPPEVERWVQSINRSRMTWSNRLAGMARELRALNHPLDPQGLVEARAKIADDLEAIANELRRV